MIRIQSFFISDYEAANKFLEKHPPRSTETQSGVVFHSDYIVIIYDDGKDNRESMVSIIQRQLEGDRSKFILAEHALKQAEIGLTEIRPEWWIEGMSNTEIKAKMVEAGEIEHEKELKSDILESTKNKIANFENEILMHQHETNRLRLSIAAWEGQLAEK